MHASLGAIQHWAAQSAWRGAAAATAVVPVVGDEPLRTQRCAAGVSIRFQDPGPAQVHSPTQPQVSRSQPNRAKGPKPQASRKQVQPYAASQPAQAAQSAMRQPFLDNCPCLIQPD